MIGAQMPAARPELHHPVVVMIDIHMHILVHEKPSDIIVVSFACWRIDMHCHVTAALRLTRNTVFKLYYRLSHFPGHLNTKRLLKNSATIRGVII